MPRHARIDIPGLLQHVIVRGIERTDIFLNDDDREDFVERLTTLLAETKTVCYAWSLIDNHFHLLLLPTEQPLATFMRRLLTGYAVSFNLRHCRTGHLFQNRYKSIVCDSDVYLLELIRYIHLNPIRAGIIKELDNLASYRWCGHQQLLEKTGCRLLAEDDVLCLFARRKNAARRSYLQFLADGIGQGKIPKLSQGGRRVSQSLDSALTDNDLYDDRVLGGGDFVERVLGPERAAEDNSLSLDVIVEKISDYYGISADELTLPSKERTIASAKAIICYLATRRNRLPGIEVAKRLGYSASAVSRAAKRGQKLFEEDRTLQQHYL